jgi:hypothetical protein
MAIAMLHKSAFSDEAAPVFISFRRGKPFCSAMKHLLFANMKHKRLKPLV